MSHFLLFASGNDISLVIRRECHTFVVHSGVFSRLETFENSVISVVLHLQWKSIVAPGLKLVNSMSCPKLILIAHSWISATTNCLQNWKGEWCFDKKEGYWSNTNLTFWCSRWMERYTSNIWLAVMSKTYGLHTETMHYVMFAYTVRVPTVGCWNQKKTCWTNTKHSTLSRIRNMKCLKTMHD